MIRLRLDLDEFKWDIKNVKTAAPEADGFWLGKYPHDAEGSVEPNGSSWQGVLDEGTAQDVASVYPLYMKTFGYT